MLNSPRTEQVTLLVSGRSRIQTQKTETVIVFQFRASTAEMADRQERKKVWEYWQKGSSSDRKWAHCLIEIKVVTGH